MEQDAMTTLFNEVDLLLRERYGVTAWDVGFDDPKEIKAYAQDSTPPEDIVAYYAVKYDLTPLFSDGDKYDELA